MELESWYRYGVLKQLNHQCIIADTFHPNLGKERTMEAYIAKKANLILILVAICLVSVLGCGVSITQETAQQAVDNAQVAFETAKESQADTYSADSLKKAERFLSEAEKALSRNKKQRAYTLAVKAEEAAKKAEEEAMQRIEAARVKEEIEQMPEVVDKTVSDQIPQPGAIPSDVLVPTGPDQYVAPLQQPEAIQYTPAPQQEPTTIPPGAPMQEGLTLADMQSRVRAAAQALEGAQSTVQAARLLILQIQVEIGLSGSAAVIQQTRDAGASADVVNLLQSWYDQSRRAAALGNYEDANRMLERAQTYAHAVIDASK
jgi:uncharacterized protein YceK